MKIKTIFGLLLGLWFLTSCSGDNGKGKLYNGRIDSDIIRLSAQTAGNIDSFQIKEGDPVFSGQVLVKINSDKAQAQLRQQQAQMEELNVNLTMLNAQIRQVEAQLKFTRETLEKTKKMAAEGAATEQRRDELATQADVQLAQLDGLKLNFQVIASKKAQLAAGMELTQITLKDARIISPFNGVVINKFFSESELAVNGKVIMELADLSEMEATIYAPLEDLIHIKIGATATLHIDGQQETMTGTVKWIASEAEFTPKTILTKETRTTLVYAVKISVPNPKGILKIGMPVDIEL